MVDEERKKHKTERRDKRGMKVRERETECGLTQEQTQQQTVPQCIRVIEREGGREIEGGGGRGRESHVGEPICLMGHQRGREGGRLRDHAEMTRHGGKRASQQEAEEEAGFHDT